MYLRDYLHDIPLKALKAIAYSLNVTVEYEARIKLINAIDKAFWDGTLVESLMNNLSDNHRRLLSIIAFSYHTGIGEKALIKKAEKVIGLHRNMTKRLIDDLLSQSLVGGIRGEENLYFCPRGIAEQIRKNCIQDIISLPDDSLPAMNASHPNLLEDIFSLLSLVYKEDISLTLMGRIKKSFLDTAFAGSPTCNDSPIHLPEEYRNSFVLEYLKRSGLIVFDHHKVCTSDKHSGWLELSMTERFQDIVFFALSHTLQDDFTILSFTGLLAEAPAGSCFNVRKLAHFLHTCTMSHGGFSRLESRVLTILKVLSQFGLFIYDDRGFIMSMTGERFFHNESLPNDDGISGNFFVQPNFEIIAGPELNPKVRFKLELLTSRKNRDMVLTYLVTQKSVGRARERGISTDEIIHFFKEHSRNTLPQNVQFSVETWAKAYGSIFFQDAVLMRFRDANMCNGVAHIPEIAPYIRERISDTVLIVGAENIQRITSHLKKSGYQPEIYGSSPKDTAASGSEFIPNSMNTILEKNRIPEFNNDFIFPRNLLNNEDSQ